ncbi:hypothetical protein [Streptomyces sp. NPDC001744]|uniref:hypothetical protein n=1 Tax=Streptomyces sp. NPDC001744 TaxID=3364606 RepID=UPI0036B78EF8
MRTRKAVAGTVLAGMLLAGCAGIGEPASPGKKGDDGKKTTAAPSASPTPAGPSVLLTVPPAYSADRGWEQPLSWMPAKYSSKPPVAVAPRSDTIAYVNTTEGGYVVQVREASTGKVRFTSRPWEPPTPLGEAGKSSHEGDKVELPSVSTTFQDGREYVVLWAHGMLGGDALTKGKEIVRLLVHPVDASGPAVAPVRQIDVPVEVYGPNSEGGKGEDDLRVEDVGGGLQVHWDGTRKGAVAVDVTSGTIDACADACAEGVGRVRTAKGWVVSGHGLGLVEMPGAWHIQDDAPSGVRSTMDKLSMDGQYMAAVGGHLLTRWRTEAGGTFSTPLVAVHNAATGKLETSIVCENPRTGEAVSSPNGRFVAAGTVAFDLQRRHGACLDAGESRKADVSVRAITDDGIAYGEVAARIGEEPGAAEADLSSGDGTPRALPAGTRVPEWALRDTGVFLTPQPVNGLLISVLKRK